MGLRGVPQQLDIVVRNQRSSKALKREKTGCGPHRIRLRLVRFLRFFVYLYMQLCSTIFVAPMFLKIARACPPLACTRPFGTPWTDYLGGNPNHRIFLSHLPYIKCVEGGHLWLTAVYFLLLIPYIYVMIPYYTCSGDGRYVSSETLDPFWKHEEHGGKPITTWSAWRAASIRKASALHLSFLHYTPKNAFITLFCELCAKILVPMVTCVADKAVEQMITLCWTCIGIWVISLMWAPYLDRKFCCFVQDMKLFAACCAACAIIAGQGVENTDATSYIAWKTLIFCGILVLFLFIFQVSVIRNRDAKIIVRKFRAEAQGSSSNRRGNSRSPNNNNNSPHSA